MPPEYSGWDPTKLHQRVIDLDNLASEASAAFEGADTVFCALGTTRPAAGSAEAFQKVDLEYVRAAAEAAKQAKVSHFSLISAQGANPRMWASNLSIAHSLLYIKTKGLVSGGCGAALRQWVNRSQVHMTGRASINVLAWLGAAGGLGE